MIYRLTEHNLWEVWNEDAAESRERRGVEPAIELLWEVWNEDAAESAYMEGKPHKKDLVDICKKEKWGTFSETSGYRNGDLEAYISRFIHIFKLKRIYTRSKWIEPNPLPKKPKGKKTVKCSQCSGCGWNSDLPKGYTIGMVTSMNLVFLFL
jgi:hypothetical protein